MKTIPFALVAAGLFVPMIVNAQPGPESPDKRPPMGGETGEGGRRPGPPGGRPRDGEGFAKAWKNADTDGDGTISRAEFDAIPRIQKLTQEKRDHIFSRFDKNGDKVLSGEEMKPERPRGEGQEAMRRFRELDTDGSGGISLEEMKAGELFKKLPPEKQEILFARLDTDGDGQITVKDKPERPFGPDGRPEKKDRPDRPDNMEKGDKPNRPRDPRRMIRDFDTDKDGSLSFEEFRTAPPHKDLTEDEQEDRFEALDKNGDKKIGESDFPSRPERPGKPENAPPAPKPE